MRRRYRERNSGGREGWEGVQKEEKESQIIFRTQPKKEKKKRKQTEVIPSVPVFCFLRSASTSGPSVPPGQHRRWNLQFSRQACLLIKHMWTCRGMGRDWGPENSPPLYPRKRKKKKHARARSGLAPVRERTHSGRKTPHFCAIKKHQLPH